MAVALCLAITGLEGEIRSTSHQRKRAAGSGRREGEGAMAGLGRLLSPIRASLGSIPSLPLPSSRNLIYARCSPTEMWFKGIQPVVKSYSTGLQSKFIMHRKMMQSISLSGRNLCTRSSIGMSIAAGTVYLCSADAYAMDGRHVSVEEQQSADPEDSLGSVKEDLYNFWILAKKFQLPVVLLVMVLLGWRRPFTLLINIVLLLSCTRPSPNSVYMFIEELRSRAMRQNNGWSISKLFYARKVDVQDYKLLCMAKVELRDRNLNLVGILGSWWVLRSSNL